MKPITKLPADTLISCFNESETDCVKVLDQHGLVLSFNPQGYKIMEIDNPKDVLGKDWLKFWVDDMEPVAKAAFNRALSGRLAYFEGYRETLKGTPRWWQVTIAPLKNSHGEIEWILAMSRDVTELHNLREENARLKAKLS